MSDVVLASLEQLELLASQFTSGSNDGLLDEAIPFFDKSINDFFNIDAIFALHGAADAYVQNSGVPTLHGLATSLIEHLNSADLWDQAPGDAALNDGPVRIRAGISAETKQAFFEFDLNLEREFRVDYLDKFSAADLNDLLSGLPLEGFEDLFTLEITATEDAALILSATLNANIAFGIDLVQVRDANDENERAEAFYLSFDPNRPWFTIRSDAVALLPGFDLELGDGTEVLFSGAISGGSIGLDTVGEIFFNDLNEDGRLTFRELDAAITGGFETDLVVFTARGKLDATFTLGAALAGFENIGQAVVQADVQNIFKTPTGQCTFEEYLANLDRGVAIDFDLSRLLKTNSESLIYSATAVRGDR